MPVENLSYSELNTVNSFLLRCIQWNYQRKISLLYRGDKLENLFNRLGLEYNSIDPDYLQMLQRLFMIGEKGRHFYSERINPPSGRRIGVDFSGQEAFALIFDHLNKAVKSKDQIHIRFFEVNGHFKSFFLEKKNKEVFIANSSRLSATTAFLYRNYYLTLLHQLGAPGYKRKSHFVSMSSNRDVAMYFSGNNDSRRVILHCWKPSTSLISRRSKMIMPLYRGVPYKWQKETSLFAGILPHYIFAVEIVDEAKLFYNPYLFISTNFDDVFIKGFDINQAAFGDILKLTNYGKAFIQRGDVIVEF